MNNYMNYKNEIDNNINYRMNNNNYNINYNNNNINNYNNIYINNINSNDKLDYAQLLKLYVHVESASRMNEASDVYHESAVP